jgi:hypothetical protein
MAFCEGVVRITKKGSPQKQSKPQVVSNFFTDAVATKQIQKSETIKEDEIKPLGQHPLDKKIIDATNYNIFHIDSVIKDHLSQQKSWLPFLEKELLELKTKDLFSDRQRIVELRKKIKDIETNFDEYLYILSTDKILQEYKDVISSQNARSFVCLDKEAAEVEIFKRDDIINKYLLIARNYAEITNFTQPLKRMCCPNCKNTDMRRSSEEDTYFKCTLCAVEVQIVDDTPSFKDIDRVNMCTRYTYTKKGHFVDAIKKHQGKQNIDPEVMQNIVNILTNEMKFHNVDSKTIQKRHLHMFMSEKNLRSYYDDLNLIYHIITGKPCDDISAYENQLLEDFDELESVLDKVSAMDENDTRVNSLNVYYKLYKLVQHRGHRCFKDDYYILKTKCKEDEHDEKMRLAFQILGWKWNETF